MENNIDKLEGIFTYELFKARGYGVYKFKDNSEGDITVTGNLEDIKLHTEYILFGQYVHHPKYGFQFEVFSYERKLESSFDGIISYLSSDLFKGVGVKTATKIVERFGLETINILKEDIDVLDELNIKSKTKDTIIAVLKTNLEYEDSFYYLLGLGLNNKDLKLILATYKENSKIIVEENPYQCYFDIYGIGFLKCDTLAKRMGYDLSRFERNVAVLAYIASELSFRTGNTYFSYIELKDAFYSMKDNISLDFDKALNDAIEDKKIINVDDRYYHYVQYNAEDEIAKFLLNNNKLDYYDEAKVKSAIDTSMSLMNITYDDKQIEAIHAFYKHKISLIVGGPGTGKTTIVRTLVDTIKYIHPEYELHIVAPTGRAAKRISELCHVSSSTIHSLLKWDKETNTFSYGIDDPLLLDVLIIDEFSMVENWLFYKLILALFNVKKIVIIGDENQLPSVGAGNLLKEIIDSNLFKVTHLDTIFRQAKRSDIITLSNDVLNNTIDFDKYNDDIHFISDDIIGLKTILVNKTQEYLNMGFSINDIEVLAPMYKGALGITNLNILLQEIFNPKDKHKKEYKTKYRTFREGDKILQLKNQASDDVYNGDIGEIVEIEETKSKVTIIAKFEDVFVEYTNEDIDKIALAYCVSVHKAQGSEYPIIFFIVSREHSFMLNKNLIYTAISRASRFEYILGDKDIFISGSRKAMRKRKTSLSYFLKRGVEDEIN